MSTRVCVKCGLVNEAAVGTAGEACPRCKAIYVKAQAEAALWKAKQARADRQEARRYGPVFVIAAVAIAGIIAYAYSDSTTDAAQERERAEQLRAAQSQVVEHAREVRAVAARTVNDDRQQRAAEKAEYDRAVTTLADVETRWKDAVAVASKSPPLALAEPLAALQEIRRETAALGLPKCMQSAQPKLVQSMEHTIQGFLTLMSAGDEAAKASATESFDDADDAARDYGAARHDCDFMLSGDYVGNG